jgi:hypothetical protein
VPEKQSGAMTVSIVIKNHASHHQRKEFKQTKQQKG